MRATRPLFRFDPGWLFVLAGLSVCAAGVLLPAQADLRGLEEQLAQLHDEEARAYQRLAAHAEFIDQVDHGDPSIIKRLAAAQLNLVPAGDKPVLLAASNGAPVTEWIDNTLDTDIRPPELEPISMLSRWASGPSRLWMFGGGIMAVFLGLMLSPEATRRGQRRSAVPSRYDTAGPTLWNDDADDDSGGERPALAVMPSLPATVDLEGPGDLHQQADTVDLEVGELPVRSRTVIDDDDRWHRSAAFEHASEVVVEADRVDAAPDDVLLWGERLEPKPAVVDAANDASVDNDAENERAGAGEEQWSIDDEARLSQTSMLFDAGEGAIAPVEAAEATVSQEEVSDAEIAKPVELPDESAEATAAASRHRKDRAARSRKPRTMSERDGAEGSSADAGARAEDVEPPVISVPRNRPAKRLVERKPKRKAAAASDDATAIPFLRYRGDVDDDDGESSEPEDDGTAMAVDQAADSIDAEHASAGDADEGDGAADGDSVK